MNQSFDIIIIGTGIVGLTCAAAFNNRLFKTAIISLSPFNEQPITRSFSNRVSAITPASQHIFEHLNVWDDIKKSRLSPYSAMQVWDAESSGDIQFTSKMVGADCLGHIIENDIMHNALYHQIKNSRIEVIAPSKLIKLIEKKDKCLLETASHGTLSARLIIGADGHHSWLRKQSDIGEKTHDYGQHAIVTTLSLIHI